MKKLGYVDHLEGRYIDVFERTKEYFKAPGVFRIRKGLWVIGIHRHGWGEEAAEPSQSKEKVIK